MIIFEHVTKRYPGGTVAVDDLGLEVPDGKIMILVGPSGYGKATTLRMVNRLVEPTGVTILLDGHDVAQARLALRRGIGYVIQQTGLFPAPDREGQHRHGPAAERLAQGEGPRPCPGTPWRAATHSSCPAGSSSASAWPGRWPQPAAAADGRAFSAVDPVVRSSLQDDLIRLQAGLRGADRQDGLGQALMDSGADAAG
jgi:osmoprotectant transport system ATP-binding protein